MVWNEKTQKYVKPLGDSHTEKRIVNGTDENSVITLSKSTGVVSADSPSKFNKWYVNVDTHGSSIFGEREYFDSKKEAEKFISKLKSKYPKGFPQQYAKDVMKDLNRNKTDKVS